MKVFMTGASGHVGSLVAAQLLENGHEISGLARSEKSAERLKNAGITPVMGDLTDLDVLTAAAKDSDGVIHLAFHHEVAFSGAADGMLKAAATDLAAIEAIADGLENSGKPFVGVNGLLQFASQNLGRELLESDRIPAGPRSDSENFIIDLANRGIRSSVIRLAPTTHGAFDNTSGFVPTLIAQARNHGVSSYIESGENQWSAVHELDAADLFVRALENAPAGTVLHAAAESGIPFKNIAEKIGQNLNLPVQSVKSDEAGKYFGHLAYFAAVNVPVSNEFTKEITGWKPSHFTLLEDLEQGKYFE